MRGIACAVAILCAQLGLGASAIAASPPDPAHSSLQGAFIDIAGTDPTGAPDPCNVSGSHCANYSMVIRDFANNPVPGAPVLLDLSNCPDIQLSTTQVGPSESQIVLCPGQVQATTDQFGRLTLAIEGRGLPNTTPGTYSLTSAGGGAGCAQLYANGEMIASALFVSAFDLDGISVPGQAVNPADVSIVAHAVAQVLIGGPQYARMDVNHTGNLNAADAAREAMMAAERLVGLGSSNTGPFCP